MKRIFFLALSLSLLNGCIYSAKVKRKNFKTPKAFAKAKSNDKAFLGRFWKDFENPELNSLIDLAFRENLDLEIARARIKAASARLGGATAGWYPQIGGSVDASRRRSIFNAGQIGAMTIEADSLSASLQASYEIDLWGKVRYARSAAKYALAASHQDLRTAYMSVAASIIDTYYLLVQQRALIKLLDQTIESRESQLTLIKKRYQSGISRAADLYQALQNLAAAKAQREQAKQALELGKHALAALIGRYPKEIDAGKLDHLPQSIEKLNVGIPGDLLLQRPDLRAAFLRLKATDQSVGAAFAAHFPSISFGGSLGYGFLDPTKGGIWSIFANLTAPIFNGGAIHAKYKENKANLKEAIAQFKKALINGVKDVNDALTKAKAISARIEHLKDRVESAKGALRLSIDQYTQGLTIYLSVLTAEQALLAAQTELISARRELVAARVSLARALGGKWMDQEIKAEEKRRKSKNNQKKEDKG